MKDLIDTYLTSVIAKLYDLADLPTSTDEQWAARTQMPRADAASGEKLKLSFFYQKRPSECAEVDPQNGARFPLWTPLLNMWAHDHDNQC